MIKPEQVKAKEVKSIKFKKNLKNKSENILITDNKKEDYKNYCFKK